MPASIDAAQTFQFWVDLLSAWDKRLYFRDQTPASLKSLFELAQAFEPTVVVELGTNLGLSLRAWLMGAPQAKVKAVDLSFEPLHRSAELIPLDLSRMELIQTDILHLDFNALWAEGDRVLLFVDAHDAPEAPIMRHVLKNALPCLPEGSLVVVDDLWHSPEEVHAENARRIFRQRVLPEIDELLLLEACYAPYHAGGSFWGFPEVVPLLRYVNQRGIHLEFSPEAKHVIFYVGRPTVDASFDETAFQKACGKELWHPLEGALTESPQVLADAMALYAAEEFEKALEVLVRLQEEAPESGGIAYALAVVLARIKRFDLAFRSLKAELSRPSSHPDAARLYAGLKTRFFRLQPAGRKRARPGLTIFSAPQSFTGHKAVLQRNAINTWIRIKPKPEILLMGNDPGVAEICREFGLRHVPDVGCDDLGVPLVDQIFLQAQKQAETETLCYVNTDILLFDDLPEAVAIAARRFSNFLLVGMRLNYDIQEELVFSHARWAETLLQHALDNGVLHVPSAMDYFVFTPGLWDNIPPFALGRFHWDSWLLDNALKSQRTVVECTPFVSVIHQNHDYSHMQGGDQSVQEFRKLGEGKALHEYKEIGIRRNIALSKPISYSNVYRTSFLMHKSGHIIRRNPYRVRKEAASR